jgi:hypothetical protein
MVDQTASARQLSRTQAFMLAVESGYTGVKAAETGESTAQGREGCARDGTVGVAQYVLPSRYAQCVRQSSTIMGAWIVQ